MSELLVLVEGRRLLLLLLLLSLLLLGRRGLLLSVSHARVVEVVEGGVDVTHMASSLHHLRLGRTPGPGLAEHHLGLDVGQSLHPGDRGGRGEDGPVISEVNLARKRSDTAKESNRFYQCN